MDTQNSAKVTPVTALSKEKGGSTIVGARQIQKALRSGRAKQVFLARNADPALTLPLEELCLQNHVPVAWVPSMSELGRACGIDVGAAAAATAE